MFERVRANTPTIGSQESIIARFIAVRRSAHSDADARAARRALPTLHVLTDARNSATVQRPLAPGNSVFVCRLAGLVQQFADCVGARESEMMAARYLRRRFVRSGGPFVCSEAPVVVAGRFRGTNVAPKSDDLVTIKYRYKSN